MTFSALTVIMFNVIDVALAVLAAINLYKANTGAETQLPA